mmetsp:Transcript_27374/g.78654  ORF Transcript_27374/g.78654 Transcript_27374/m.78654 type:complete len:210 (+) Transcript_27374:1166-1795(+)
MAGGEAQHQLASGCEQPDRAVCLRRGQQRRGHRCLPRGPRAAGRGPWIPQWHELDETHSVLLRNDGLGHNVVLRCSRSPPVSVSNHLREQGHLLSQSSNMGIGDGEVAFSGADDALQLLQQLDAVRAELHERFQLLYLLRKQVRLLLWLDSRHLASTASGRAPIAARRSAAGGGAAAGGAGVLAQREARQQQPAAQPGEPGRKPHHADY